MRAEALVIRGKADLSEFGLYLVEDFIELFMALRDPNPNHIDPVQVREGPKPFELSLELRELRTIQDLFDSVDRCLRYLAQETERKVHYVWVDKFQLGTCLFQALLRRNYPFTNYRLIQIHRHETSNAILRQLYCQLKPNNESVNLTVHNRRVCEESQGSQVVWLFKPQGKKICLL